MKTRTKWLIFAVSALLFIIYLFFFFQQGISFGDSFLKKSGNDTETVFSGWNGDVEMSITIQRQSEDNCTIHFVRGDVQHEYKVESPGALDTVYHGIVMIEDGQTLFEGKFIPGNFNGITSLYQLDDNLYLKDLVVVGTGTTGLTSLSPTELFILFTEQYRLRGDFTWFIPAIFILLVWGIDLRFPRFFFLCEHILSVENPEPSEFYLTMQAITWFVFPIAAVILFVIAIV